MKNIFKILTVFTVLVLFGDASFALNLTKLDKLITKSNLNDVSTVAVSVRNADNGTDIYSYNQNKLLHPASVLKIFTAYSSLEELGYDYNFKTEFYKDNGNNLYIKLGADPLLTTAQLKKAFAKLKTDGNTSFKNLYFDDSILDKKEFAKGWMWDDDINPSTPKVSAYNLDGNVININLTKGTSEVNASLKPDYATSVRTNIGINNNADYLDVERYNWLSPEIIEITGSIKNSVSVKVPVSSMRRYFIYNTNKILNENKITVSGTSYASKIVPDEAKLIGEISNPVTGVLTDILQNSSNLPAETIFKLSAAKKYNSTGNDLAAAVVFNDFYEKLGLKTDKVIIKDGCGVSRNNLFTADWITSALNKIYKLNNFETFKNNMAQPGDGTLASRLYDLRGNAWLKTGSLSNISTIAGYVHSLDGHTYAVAVLIQNFKEKQQDIKSFEDEIITTVYNK